MLHAEPRQAYGRAAVRCKLVPVFLTSARARLADVRVVQWLPDAGAWLLACEVPCAVEVACCVEVPCAVEVPCCVEVACSVGVAAALPHAAGAARPFKEHLELLVGDCVCNVHAHGASVLGHVVLAAWLPRLSTQGRTCH